MVVKQMLYSCMMEGYRELKSSSSTNLSYSPFFGSKTSPPAYWGPLAFLESAAAHRWACTHDADLGQASRHPNIIKL